MADPTAVIPPPFDPNVSIFIDLDREDCSNHLIDVYAFLFREILQPIAGEGQEPHTCALKHTVAFWSFGTFIALNMSITMSNLARLHRT